MKFDFNLKIITRIINYIINFIRIVITIDVIILMTAPINTIVVTMINYCHFKANLDHFNSNLCHFNAKLNSSHSNAKLYSYILQVR